MSNFTMKRSFMANISSQEELQALQLEGLKWTVRHAYDNSAFYRQRFQKAAVKPDDIRSLDDLRRLPFAIADDLRQGYPFPFRAVTFDRIVRIHASSGTTGKRKVLCYTQRDIDDWADMFARCYEMAGLSRKDRVQIAVGYGLWTAGVGFQLGCERFGAMAVPLGPGNTEMHCQMLVDMQSTVFCATASMGLLMAEEVQRRNLRDQSDRSPSPLPPPVEEGEEKSGNAFFLLTLAPILYRELVTGRGVKTGTKAGVTSYGQMNTNYGADQEVVS